MQLRKERTEKNSGLYGIQTLDVSNQLSEQTNWELFFFLNKNWSFPGFKPFTKIGHLRIITFKMRLSAKLIFLVKMAFICMRIKNHFHIALSLAWK